VPRANSWDLFLHPASLGAAAVHGLGNPRAILLTVLLTAFLSAGYLAVYALAQASSVWTSVVEREAPSAAASSKPRILIVVTLAEVGGAQRSVSNLLPALGREFDVTVAAHGSGLLRDTAQEAGFPFIALDHLRRDIHPWHDVLALVELIRLYRRAQPDVVHLHSSKAGILGRLAAVVARVPIRVFTVHGWSFAAYRGPAGRLFLWAERLVRPLTTAVICVSHASRKQGIAARACDPGRTVVIHNAVDTTSFLPPRRTEGRPRIISVARFAFPKDFAALVGALALVSADFRATFVGEGPALSEIATIVEMQGLEGKVELLGARGDVRELLASSDVFVLSSRSEGHPVSLLEAMAAGLPVVATDVGGVAESVVHGQTGLLVPAGNVTALAAALERLVDDEQLRRRLGTAGRVRARELFDLAPFRSCHVELYHRELERIRVSRPQRLGKTWRIGKEASA
jgi:glycosyltransferase involved in cell wall biosynthesis